MSELTTDAHTLIEKCVYATNEIIHSRSLRCTTTSAHTYIEMNNIHTHTYIEAFGHPHIHTCSPTPETAPKMTNNGYASVGKKNY